MKFFKAVVESLETGGPVGIERHPAAAAMLLTGGLAAFAIWLERQGGA
jgi:hypothetical protein